MFNNDRVANSMPHAHTLTLCMCKKYLQFTLFVEVKYKYYKKYR